MAAIPALFILGSMVMAILVLVVLVIPVMVDMVTQGTVAMAVMDILAMLDTLATAWVAIRVTVVWGPGTAGGAIPVTAYSGYPLYNTAVPPRSGESQTRQYANRSGD